MPLFIRATSHHSAESRHFGGLFEINVTVLVPLTLERNPLYSRANGDRFRRVCGPNGRHPITVIALGLVYGTRFEVRNSRCFTRILVIRSIGACTLELDGKGLILGYDPHKSFNGFGLIVCTV